MWCRYSMCNKTCSKTMLPMHYKVLLWISPTAASRVELLTGVTDLHLNKLQIPTEDQLRSSLFLKQILLYLCIASIHSRGPLLLSLGMWQTEKSQLWCPKQGCPGDVEIQFLFIIVGMSRSAPPAKLEKSHPSFYYSKHLQFCGGGFADISEMTRQLLRDLVTREQTRAR